MTLQDGRNTVGEGTSEGGHICGTANRNKGGLELFSSLVDELSVFIYSLSRSLGCLRKRFGRSYGTGDPPSRAVAICEERE